MASANQTEAVIEQAATRSDWERVATLFRAYADSLEFSLEFQCFGRELERLPGDYGAPRGAAFLAWLDRNPVGAPVGVVAIRPLEDGLCELKRLYVAPKGRAKRIGLRLSERAIEWATDSGYRAMRLDTHDSMVKAIELYGRLGFGPIDAYNDHRLAGMRYFEREL